MSTNNSNTYQSAVIINKDEITICPANGVAPSKVNKATGVEDKLTIIVTPDSVIINLADNNTITVNTDSTGTSTVNVAHDGVTKSETNV